MFELILASFSIENKLKKTQFFSKTFKLTDTSKQVVFFLIFSNANILYSEQKLI